VLHDDNIFGEGEMKEVSEADMLEALKMHTKPKRPLKAQDLQEVWPTVKREYSTSDVKT